MSTDLSPHERAFSWVARESDSELTVSFSGELDLAIVPECSAGLREPISGSATVIVLDLSAVTFADTTALRFLIDTKRQVEADGKRLFLKETSSAVVRLFEAAGLTSWFDYVNGHSPSHELCPLCDGQVPAGRTRCGHCGGTL